MDNQVDSISLEPMSIGNILYSRQISELEYDKCKSSFLVQSCLANNQPLFQGKMEVPGKDFLDLSVFLDSGSSSSFIDNCFVQDYSLKTDELASPYRIKLFDGSAVVSGNVTTFVTVSIFIPLVTGKFLQSTVWLFVTWLSSANVIFGSSWLKATNTFIGGTNNSIIINGCIL
jgi:hypothetical protein